MLLDAEAVRLSLGGAVDEALRERDADGDCKGDAAALLDRDADCEQLAEALTLGETTQRP